MFQKEGCEAENVENLAFSECRDLCLKSRTIENKIPQSYETMNLVKHA